MIKKKILLVDDEEDICFLTKINIEQSGLYEVDTTYSGEDAIICLRDHEYDLVITDFKMGAVSGKDVLEFCKKEKPGLAVFIFSVFHDDPDTVSSSVIELADRVLKKPIESVQLLREINDFFNGSS